LDKVFIPVNHRKVHWGLAVINFIDKRFEYYDSLRWGPPARLLEHLRKYVKDEAATYNKLDYNLDNWVDHVASDIPIQHRGSGDCGVFMCKFADYLSDGLDLTFSAGDMLYFRRRMLVEILENKVK
jgi:sentrin-specific protease 1